MPNPSNKSEALNSHLEDLSTLLYGKSRVDTITKGVACVTCKGVGRWGPNLDFRDDLSRKEYSISGMCQDCQDSVFGA